MKIKPKHFDHMKDKINQVIENSGGVEFVVNKYENGLFPNAQKVKDLQCRFCFDLLYAAGLTRFVIDEIYTYANDKHLLTALKKIAPIVERKY